jgi:serine/threonine protein kinase
VSDDAVTGSETASGHYDSWGSLQILEEIGRGGFGVVYRAWEPGLAREVALKIIRPRPDHGPEALAAILREGQLLARVRHPNVVTVHGSMQIGDEVGIWMEFVHGKSLSRLVKEEGPRAAAEAAVIGISLCQAAAAVHQAGVIHRDIKAHNVMREAGGRIVLMDFGAGQLLDTARRTEDHNIGTPAYMAPEVLAGGKASQRSDVYSIGVLLYYLVTGTYPVDGETWTDFLLAHARFERTPLGDVRPDVPARFVRVVEKATSIRPDDRYGSPGAMLSDLTTAATGVARPVRRASQTDSRKRKAAEPKLTTIRIAPIAAAVLLPTVGIWTLGAITSIVFNHTLNRPAEFRGEGIWDWWGWGFSALVPGTVQSIVVVILLTLIVAVWRLLRRAAPPVARIGKELTDRRSSAASRIGFDDPDVASQALLAAQIIGVGLFCWYFRDIFSAMLSFISEASAAEVEALRPEYLDYHQWYNFAMSMMILAMSAGVWRIAKMRRRTGQARHASLFAIGAMVVVSLVVLVLPYRLIWHNDFEVAGLNGERCYILGTHESSALVYCPGQDPPKVRSVPLDGAGLKPSGEIQSIYTR